MSRPSRPNKSNAAPKKNCR